MPRYRVTVQTTCWRYITVEAENAEEAVCTTWHLDAPDEENCEEVEVEECQ